jgi:Putative adhesin
MRYSKAGIIALLLAAEVFIAGAIVWSLGMRGGFSVKAAALHQESGDSKVFAPIDAGTSPHVSIDDPDSHVVITTSTDGKIHVTDASQFRGIFWGDASRAPLQVSRTDDGVSIVRAPGHGVRVQIFGFSQERVEVAVPERSMLDVKSCSAADVTGLRGNVRVHSVDGHIAATDVRTNELTIASDDGRLMLDNVSAAQINATTKDGSIHARGVETAGGTLHSDDGSITLALAPNVNVGIRAHTTDGHVTLDGRRATRNDDDSSNADYNVGTGGGSLEVSTQDGSIHITTNGAQ